MVSAGDEPTAVEEKAAIIGVLSPEVKIAFVIPFVVGSRATLILPPSLGCGDTSVIPPAKLL
jgi:hypothetical protein